MIDFGYNPAAKPSQSKRAQPTQRQRGDIGKDADAALKERSLGICELCGKAPAAERAHLTGRKHIKHKTTASDLAHVCVPCHQWLDRDVRGIQVRRLLATIIEHHEGSVTDGSSQF